MEVTDSAKHSCFFVINYDRKKLYSTGAKTFRPTANVVKYFFVVNKNKLECLPITIIVIASAAQSLLEWCTLMKSS